MEDADVRSKVMWENMQLVEPWENEEVSDDIFTINPTFLPRDRLSAAQQAVSVPHCAAAIVHHVTDSFLAVLVFLFCDNVSSQSMLLNVCCSAATNFCWQILQRRVCSSQLYNVLL